MLLVSIYYLFVLYIETGDGSLPCGGRLWLDIHIRAGRFIVLGSVDRVCFVMLENYSSLSKVGLMQYQMITMICWWGGAGVTININIEFVSLSLSNVALVIIRIFKGPLNTKLKPHKWCRLWLVFAITLI